MAYINTSDGHQLYYEHHGNLDGPSVLFLHGGPGLGTTQNDLGYFDLAIVNVILLDQRGAGKSQPTGSLVNNTPQHLVADIVLLLKQLQIEKIILFGGSWGSTLALLFAITHPNRVEGLVLRGLFTASKKERQFFEEGGTALFYPKATNRYLKQVPKTHSGSIGSYYFQHILEGQPEAQCNLAYELMYYGISVSRKVPYTQSEIESRLEGASQRHYARILAHFSVNNFFLPDEYIIKQLHTISHIPIHLIQGRYDMITTPQLAIQLAELHENFRLKLVDGGHSPHEATVKTALQEEMVNLLARLS